MCSVCGKQTTLHVMGKGGRSKNLGYYFPKLIMQYMSSCTLSFQESDMSLRTTGHRRRITYWHVVGARRWMVAFYSYRTP